MKLKRMSYQISISLNSGGCKVLQRKIQAHHPAVWTANHFVYEKASSSSQASTHQLGWSEPCLLSMPAGLKSHLECLHRESQDQALSLRFAVALPAPHWFMARIPESLQNRSQVLQASLQAYLSQMVDDDWVFDCQASGVDDARSSSEKTSVKNNQMDLLICSCRMVYALKEWLSPFGWQWSLMDIDFGCLLRVLDFFCATQINCSDKTILLCARDENQMDLYLWKNQQLIFFTNTKKYSESSQEWMEIVNGYLSIFLEQMQIDVILFSGQMIQMRDKQAFKADHRDVFYLDDVLPFSSVYLFNMGLLLKSGWACETI